MSMMVTFVVVVVRSGKAPLSCRHGRWGGNHPFALKVERSEFGFLGDFIAFDAGVFDADKAFVSMKDDVSISTAITFKSAVMVGDHIERKAFHQGCDVVKDGVDWFLQNGRGSIRAFAVAGADVDFAGIGMIRAIFNGSFGQSKCAEFGVHAAFGGFQLAVAQDGDVIVGAGRGEVHGRFFVGLFRGGGRALLFPFPWHPFLPAHPASLSVRLLRWFEAYAEGG